ncbi:virulence RhuM family protein [Sphingomonas sp. So64.6b]|uniref:RhuM family protein n=1 Tax=Sphingomonas sp. So64.6b TaxID=2997354 RepID=UPI0016001E12|nr:RhuM family protein [Sphingomonas sp. So64.6b]QNA82685.1 virulence RhuM family protein [Sphingomonas sp. So64.6b]
MTPDEMKRFLAKARKSREAANDIAAQIEMELMRFDGENAPIDFNVDWSEETVWATQKQMADLFGKDVHTISEHLATLYDSDEFERKATVRNFRIVRLEGARQVAREIEHYNLDVVLVIGYRVNGTKAAEFRKWANQILKAYITDGYALNKERLRSEPSALRDLAAKVRALRSEESNIYSAVRDCFKECALDYDKASSAARSFYARIQDRFMYAATGKVAAQIVLERADGTKPNMGMTVVEGRFPKKADCLVGKNYLFSDELYVLHIMCEQFLLFAESKALRGQPTTMADLSLKLDQLFAINEYPIFPGYQDYLREKAKEHAQVEWNLMAKRLGKGEAA